MASPLIPPPQDPVDHLASLIDHYHNTPECNHKIAQLCDTLSKIISGHDHPMLRAHSIYITRILAKVDVVICPKIKGRFQAIEALKNLSGTAAQHCTLQLPIQEIGERFLRGELNSQEDIPLINYLIMHSTRDSPLYAHPKDFIHQISTATADASCATLLKKDPEFFKAHLPIIMAKLGSLEGKKPIFFEALSEDTTEIKALIETHHPDLWEQFELHRKSGEMWECTHREIAPSGVGFLYTFTLGERYRNTHEFKTKESKIFPAIEPPINEVSETFNIAPAEKYLAYCIAALERTSDPSTLSYYTEKIKRVQAKIANLKLLKELGYRFSPEGTTLTFPDREALTYSYEQLRTTNPDYVDLPPLSIDSGDGIASDLEFILKNILHHGIISSGKEFVHDQYAHIIPLLQRANLRSEKFQELNHDMIGLYDLILAKIGRASEDLGGYTPIFYTLLGAYVDAVSNGLDGIETTFADLRTFNLLSILKSSAWKLYIMNRYDDPEMGPLYDEETISRLLLEHIQNYSPEDEF